MASWKNDAMWSNALAKKIYKLELSTDPKVWIIQKRESLIHQNNFLIKSLATQVIMGNVIHAMHPLIIRPYYVHL